VRSTDRPGLRAQACAVHLRVDPYTDVYDAGASECRGGDRALFADNVLPTASGGLCVIDWENSGPADPSQELAVALFEFGSGEAQRARALSHAYRSAGGPGCVDRPGRFSMAIAQFAHMAELDGQRWLGARDPADRQRPERRMGEFLDDALTRRRIDEILTAVAH
jgi:Phosphotransferase enzyme family